MKIEKIYIGGWFQRTTLHLSEVYDFLKESDSPLDFNKKKLQSSQENLELESVTMHIGELEFIEVLSKVGITIKIFEDGLIVLNKDYELAQEDVTKLTTYYEKKLSPAINYIFSLGAPVPKELAHIKTIYPYFIVLEKAQKDDIKRLLKEFKQEKYFAIEEKTFEIYRGNKLYIINNLGEKLDNIERLINEQIFFREFKGQLHRYLNLHRIIWEKIAAVKEKGEIKGKNIGQFKAKIERYNKTIDLIRSRINQMGTYIGTRGVIAKNNAEFKRFISILQFKYETLADTLSYIKELWQMTKNYVASALKLFSDIQAKSTETTVKNLTVITSMGVGATLIGLFTAKKFPDFTWFGILYFVILAFIGYSVNKIMKYIYINRKYKIKDVEIDKDIK